MIYLLTILAYLLGSIPFGLILSKLAGIGDIRNIGSGNIGATNVLRTGNKKIAAATLLCDALKGFIPVYIAHKHCMQFPEPVWFEAVVAFVSVLGHVFPVWLRFKGGKGVATTLGVYFAIDPSLGLITLAIWLIMAKVFRISSLAALVAAVLSPVTAIYLSNWCVCTVLFYITVPIAFLILCTHHENIKRIISGAESTVSLDK